VVRLQKIDTEWVDELTYHLATILTEAKQGDAEARRWLLDSFPGHGSMFEAHWAGQRIQGLAANRRYKRAAHPQAEPPYTELELA
jgi:hypothetical protein